MVCQQGGGSSRQGGGWCVSRVAAVAGEGVDDVSGTGRLGQVGADWWRVADAVAGGQTRESMYVGIDVSGVGGDWP